MTNQAPNTPFFTVGTEFPLGFREAEGTRTGRRVGRNAGEVRRSARIRERTSQTQAANEPNSSDNETASDMPTLSKRRQARQDRISENSERIRPRRVGRQTRQRLLSPTRPGFVQELSRWQTQDVNGYEGDEDEIDFDYEEGQVERRSFARALGHSNGPVVGNDRSSRSQTQANAQTSPAPSCSLAEPIPSLCPYIIRCPVCLMTPELLQQSNRNVVASKKCGHIFCQLCFDELNKRPLTAQCPICQRRFGKQTPLRIFL